MLYEKDIFAVRGEEHRTALMVAENIKRAKENWFLLGNASGIIIGAGVVLAICLYKGIW